MVLISNILSHGGHGSNLWKESLSRHDHEQPVGLWMSSNASGWVIVLPVDLYTQDTFCI